MAKDGPQRLARCPRKIAGRRSQPGSYHNTGGLAFWFLRAERYERKAGMPYQSVRQRRRDHDSRDGKGPRTGGRGKKAAPAPEPHAATARSRIVMTRAPFAKKGSDDLGSVPNRPSAIDRPGDDCCARAESKQNALAGCIMNQLISGNEKGWVALPLSVGVGFSSFGGRVGLILRSWERCDVQRLPRRFGPRM